MKPQKRLGYRRGSRRAALIEVAKLPCHNVDRLALDAVADQLEIDRTELAGHERDLDLVLADGEAIPRRQLFREIELYDPALDEKSLAAALSSFHEKWRRARIATAARASV